MGLTRKTIRKSAIAAVERAGVLLVFPVKNARTPTSLWYELYPRSEMRWDWGEQADPRVIDLWHLRTELSASTEIVYSKWFRGRATLFSREAFVAMARLFADCGRRDARALSPLARSIYELLLDDSPQTSRQLRSALDLLGRPNEAIFNRGLKELWEGLFAVGFGEVEEGSYPSLAIGAAKLLFEDLWEEAAVLPASEAERRVEKFFSAPDAGPFTKQFAKLRKPRSF